jgi:BlaI family transcriptional regulator, penicillinase repressor
MAISFTDRELDIMSVLWNHGPSTVAEVQERLPDELAYKTVLTMLRILESKGYVAHEEEGRAHRFHPLVGQEEASGSALGRVLERVFGGSEEMLLLRLVEARKLDRAEIGRLRSILDERMKEEEQ